MKGKWILSIGLALVVVAAGLVIVVVAGGLAYNRGPVVVKHSEPTQVVTDFYNGYLDTIRSGEGLRNPLVDGTYRSSEFLADTFIAEIDGTLASFDKGGYDPILMAQDIPESVTVGEAFIDGDEAQVHVDTSFEGHGLTVTLKRLDGRWQITGVSLAPDVVVSSFYEWYLWYSRGGEEMRNPLVDGAYRDCEALTGDFVAEIDETLASFDRGGFDPILLAQDVPERVEVGEVTITGNEAKVTVLMFWGHNPTPSERIVNLVLADGTWKIDAVSL